MKKIVINKSSGGFRLSEEAISRYCEMKGIRLYPEQSPYGPGVRYYWTAPKSEIPAGQENSFYFMPHDIDRDDELLIRVVEELGEKASDTYANLKVVEIPDNVEWKIEECGGHEHIAEVHRTWD